LAKGLIEADFCFINLAQIKFFIKMITIKKYPRTPHIQGSKFQHGDEDLENIPFDEIKGKFLVIEEKMDGANSGISFSDNGELLLQSRGHYLTGGYRERHFDLFKTWAHTYSPQMWEVIKDEFIIYGEWMFAKHTVYYTHLEHYFLEFDIYDKANDCFLSTKMRNKLLEKMPFIKSVKILYEGILNSKEQLKSFMTQSYFINNNHLDCLKEDTEKLKLNFQTVLKETNKSNIMEGLYIKQESDNTVDQRFKYVRSDFLNSIMDSETHWLDRPIIPNRLAKDINLFN